MQYDREPVPRFFAAFLVWGYSLIKMIAPYPLVCDYGASVFAFAAVGVARTVAIGLGLDGSLHLFDASGAGWFTER